RSGEIFLMPNYDIQSWSITPGTNATADSGINFAEGQARASLNDSCRAMMAAHAFMRNLLNGSITTTGSANAYAFTSGLGYVSVPTGLCVRIKANFTNTGAATLNMDGIGAVTMKRVNGNDLNAGDLNANQYFEALYNGTNWIVLLYAFDLGPVLLNTLTASASATLDDTTSIVASYNQYMIELNHVIPATDASGLWMRVQSGGTFKTSLYATTMGGHDGFNTFTYEGQNSNGTLA